MSKRFAVVVAATMSVSLVAACETAPGGSTAGKATDGAAANPENTAILARGWEMPKETGVAAGPKSVRGAHTLVAIDPPDGDEIETADIPGPGQGGNLSGNPAAAVTDDPAKTAEVIVRSLRN